MWPKMFEGFLSGRATKKNFMRLPDWHRTGDELWVFMVPLEPPEVI